MNHKLFEFPHKAIRNLMFQISTQFATAFTYEAFKKIKPLLNDVKFLLENHLHTENDYIIPLLKDELIQSTEHEHHEVEVMQTHLFRFLFSLDESNYQSHYYRAELELNNFIGEYLLHMNHEETIVQDEIWTKYSDESQAEVEMNIIKKFSPEELFIWMKYGLAYVPEGVRSIRLSSVAGIISKEHNDILVKIFGNTVPSQATATENNLSAAGKIDSVLIDS